MARITTQTVWTDPSRAFSGQPQSDAERAEQDCGGRISQQADLKWPAWQVTLGVILFCGTFWAGLVSMTMDLLS